MVPAFLVPDNAIRALLILDIYVDFCVDIIIHNIAHN